MSIDVKLLEEYRVATRNAGLIDFSARTKIELTGPDRVAFLQNFCTSDVAGLPPGGGGEAFITTGQAKIVAHVIIAGQNDSLWLDADEGLAEKIAQHLDRYLIIEQVVIADRTTEVAQLRIIGPQANSALTAILPDVASLTADLQSLDGKIGEVTCLVRRNDSVANAGYDIVVPVEKKLELLETLKTTGAKEISLETYEILRVEAGWPEYGKDIDESNLPQEVGRDERAISFTKGCYLGQETVARILAYGHVNRLLVGLKLAGDRIVSHGTHVYYDGKEIGQITSCVFSPRMQSAVALAMIRRNQSQPGSELDVLADEQRVSATVVRLPFNVA